MRQAGSPPKIAATGNRSPAARAACHSRVQSPAPSSTTANCGPRPELSVSRRLSPAGRIDQHQPRRAQSAHAGRIGRDQQRPGDRRAGFVGPRADQGQRGQVDVARPAARSAAPRRCGPFLAAAARPVVGTPIASGRANPGRVLWRSSDSVRRASSSSWPIPSARQARAGRGQQIGHPRQLAAAHAVEQQGRGTGFGGAADDFGQFFRRIDFGADAHQLALAGQGLQKIAQASRHRGIVAGRGRLVIFKLHNSPARPHADFPPSYPE